MTVNLEQNAPMNATSGWEGILAGGNLHRLEHEDLPKFLVRQRWFAAKSRSIASTRLLDWAILGQSVLCLIEVQFEDRWTDTYFLPLAMAFGDAGEQLRERTPNSIVARVTSDNILICDGMVDDLSCQALFSVIENGSELPGRAGRMRGEPGGAFQEVLGPAQLPLPVRRGSAEQSNSSIVYGDRFILKLYRRPEVGENPDCEIGKYLTEEANFDRIPPFAGVLRYLNKDGTGARTLAMLQGLVKNDGDGWEWSLGELDRYYQNAMPNTLPDETTRELRSGLEFSDWRPSPLEREYVGEYLDSAAILGRRTAQLHLALAARTTHAQFRPEPFTGQELENLLVGMREHGSAVFRLLEEQIVTLPQEVKRLAASVLGQREHILDSFRSPESEGWDSQRIRIHGDYHLGQVLRTQDDFVILDFEGEPARPLAERRQKQCPLKDVAGMLRSFSYAAYVGLFNFCELHSHDSSQLAAWPQLWERSAVRVFLHIYRQTAANAAFLPATSSDFRKLLKIFVLDKALYEVRYELNSRPRWVRIPLLGILSLKT